MFYEIRRYQIQPGRRDEWVRYMEEVIIPFQAEQGMSITASFVDEEDPDAYVWMRRFDSEEQRAELYERVYGSDRWKNDIGVKARELIASIQVTRAVPTPASGLR